MIVVNKQIGDIFQIVLKANSNNNLLLLCNTTRNYAVQAAVQAGEPHLKQQSIVEWNEAKSFSSIPGPSKMGLLTSFIMPGGKYKGLSIMQLNKKMYDEYGSITKLPGVLGKPDMIMAFDPNDIEKIFRNEGIWPIRRGMDAFAYYRNKKRPDIFKGMGGLVSEQGESWQEMRTAVNPVMLQPKTVKMYVPHVDEVVMDFINKISKTLDDNLELPANFGFELNKWSLESIGVIALDQRLGVLLTDSVEAQQLIASIQDFFILAYEIQVLPSFYKYYETQTFKKLMKCFDDLTTLIKKYVDEAVHRLDNDPKSMAQNHEMSVLEKLLKIDRHIAIIMAMDMLLAGVDTTSAAVVSCLYNLAKNPLKQAKLRDEIKTIAPNKETKLTENCMNNAPYLKACIKESMRLSPVAPGNLRAAGKDMVLQGYKIPKGTDVVMGSFILQHDSEHFSKADEFLPERWLKKEDMAAECPSAKTANPFIYLPFGFGPRSCIGRRFAEMEIQVFLTRLLSEFSVEWNYGPMKYVNGIIITPASDLKFKLVKL